MHPLPRLFLPLLVCSLTVPCRAGDTGFLERFALAADRDAVLKDLIPGTDDHYYYHAVHLQNQRKTAELAAVLKEWTARFEGDNPRRNEIVNRQAIIDYTTDPAASLRFLGERFGLAWNHQRITPEARPELPTTLDPAAVSWDAFLAAALAGSDNLGQLTPRGLVAVVRDGKLELTAPRRRDLLSRLHRPDLPDLVRLVNDDLGAPESRGFGEFPIHGMLTVAQLEELLQLRPDLLQGSGFVEAWLQKLRPAFGEDPERDPAVREAWLDRLEAFTARLAPSFNSLKAHVLHHRLRHDRSRGVLDEARLLAYLQLPRPLAYVRPQWRESDAFKDPVDVNADFVKVSGCQPVGDDEALVRSLLLELLAERESAEAFAPWLDERWLNAVHAEARLVAGAPDAARWVSLLPADSYQALRERVDMDFAPSLRSEWAPADEVTLDLSVKNVRRLLVKVYEINTENVHRTTGAQVNTDLDLDGLSANSERTLDFDDPPLLRRRHSIALPELKDRRGVWIVEFIGAGKSSRALVRKGALLPLVRNSAAGTLLSVFDEARQPVREAWALLGTRRFDAGPDGIIALPFSTEPGDQNVIIGDASGFTSLERIPVAGEACSLQAGFHVPCESLLPGATAALAIRPALLVNGRPASPDALGNVRVTIASTTLDGVRSSVVHGLEKLDPDAETTVEFSVPDRLASLEFTLDAELRSLTTGAPVNLQATGSLKVNGITLTEQTSDLHLTAADGGFLLEERGRSGEPRPEREVTVTFSRPEFTNTIALTLRTDAAGTVRLGRLDGVSSLTARTASGVERTFALPADRASLPPALNVRTGEPFQIAWRGPAQAADGDVSLLELRGGTPVRDAAGAASVRHGLVTVAGLEPGEYRLELAPTAESTVIRVAAGETVSGHLLGSGLTMELSSPAPVAVVSMSTARRTRDEAKPVLVFRIANAGVDTRVHLAASRFVPRSDAFAALGRDHLPQPMTWTTAWRPSLYQDARVIGEEYRYVLERRGAVRLAGNLLPRPGLLLNPWAVSETLTGTRSAQAGEEAEAMKAERPIITGAPVPAGGPAEPGAPPAAAMEPDLSFLATAGAVAWNLRPDKNGDVVIDAESLGDRQFIRVLAVNSDSAAVRDFTLPEKPLAVRDLRLAGALPPDGHFSRQNRITLLEKEVPFPFRDALTARWQSIGNMGAAHSLLFNLTGNAALAEFSWLLKWPELTPDQRRERYSQNACHELHFFLARKDPAFFKAVIQPHLANKRDKTFMDHYLLGSDLSPWLQPWAWDRLNIVERILLARRIETEQPAIRRLLREWLDTLPSNPQRDAFLFETALEGRALSVASAEGKSADGMDRFEGESSVKFQNLNRTWDADFDAGTGQEETHFSFFSTAGGGAPAAPLSQVDAIVRLEALDDTVESLGFIAGKEATVAGDDYGAATQWHGRYTSRGASAVNGREEKRLRKRLSEQQVRLFRQVDRTKEWAESNYHRLTIAARTAELVTPDAFWLDYALWDGTTPFLSPHLAETAGSFTEMMFALAALDLPFPSQAPKGRVDRKDNTVTLVPGGKAILFHQEIRRAEPDKDGPPLLVARNFYRQGDRYTEQAGEKLDKFVTDEFLAGVVYGCQVVVTNPTSSRQKLDLLFQIPQGAMPVLATQATASLPVVIEPHHTGTWDFHFYFPRPGDFPHFPVHVSREGRTAASAAPFTFKVVPRPTGADKSSWAHVSQHAEPAEVLTFLDQNNLHTLNLDLMAWRLKDADFARRAIALLRSRHVWHATTWSYAFLHDIPEAVTDYLQHSDAFLATCGAWLDAPLLRIDPVERRTWQHLEYSPLVNARAHQLGATRTILNDRLAAQFAAFLRILMFRPALDHEDRLAVTYHLALQDRIEEAIARFAAIDPAKIAEKLQYDYLQAWLAMCQADTATARRIATAHAAHPVDHWKAKFTALASQLDEIEGKAAAAPKDDDRDATQDRLAAKEPAISVKIENKTVALDYRNLTEVTLNYYPMDLEFLFSANPFVTQDTGRFRVIRPNKSEKVMLPGGDHHVFALPKEFQSANVLVEITGGGLTKAAAAYANELKVTFSEGFGTLQVQHAVTKQPLPRTYVKVFAERGGSPVFYKDGYTDLRGRFDFASLSTGDLEGTTRFAILVMSDEHGALVREVRPPQR